MTICGETFDKLSVLGSCRFLLFSLGALHVCYHFCFLETSYRKAIP